MSENITTPTAAAEVSEFAAETVAKYTGKKGYVSKFFAELMPKYNELLALHREYKSISGGVEAAQRAAIDGLTEESNPEMFEVFNSLAEAEELVAQLNAQLAEWAASTVAESTESPESIKEKFAAIKADYDSKVNGAADYFERNEDIVEDDEGKIVADSEDGAFYLALKDVPSMRRGKGTKVVNPKGKMIREFIKANGVTGPEGQELGKIGVIPTWAVEAFDAAQR